jgi:beta-N-acetylhexosaminidase
MNSGLSNFGLRFIVEPSSTRLSKEESQAIKILQPAGFMLRKRNFLQQEDHEVFNYQSWVTEYSLLVGDLVEAIEHNHFILSIDHEGGRVIRPPLPITRFPYPLHWRELSRDVAKVHATELRSLSINLSFAPVLDLFTNPANPVIGERAFASSSNDTLNYAFQYFSEIEKSDIAGCVKHFPGHGDTSSDSHWELPIINKKLEELEARELIPFRAAINWPIRALMPGHLLVSSVDNEMVPASKIWLNNILREQYGYKGVIISDALAMKAILSNLKDSSFIAQLNRATLDLYLFGGDNLNIRDALYTAQMLRDVSLKEKEQLLLHNSAIARIKAFIASLALIHKPTLLDQSVFLKHQALASKIEANQKKWWDVKLEGFE